MLQKRIYQASKLENKKLVCRLQRLLFSSWYAKCLAVRKIPCENHMELAKCLESGSIKTKLGEEALQELVKLVLEPEWEGRFSENMYGFRPGRFAQDAIEAIFTSVNKQEKYALVGEIDLNNLKVSSLVNKLDTFPKLKSIVKKWKDLEFPLFVNVMLSGLEKFIIESFPKSKTRNGKYLVWTPRLISFGKNIVVLHRDVDVIKECQELINNWLKDSGLVLANTAIKHTLTDGFDFIGFNIRQHRVGKYHSGYKCNKSSREMLGFKTIITPSKESMKIHLNELKDIAKIRQSATQEVLINSLNSIIRSWSNYYRFVCSSKAFRKMNFDLYSILRSWARKRHPKKSNGWIARKYWLLPNWDFGTKTRKSILAKHYDTEIERFTKVKGDKSPFDGDWQYWTKRRMHLYAPSLDKIIHNQKGKCNYCGLYFDSNSLVKIYKKEQSKGLEALHCYCHEKFFNGSLLTDKSFEEPDEVKVSRPVLKTNKASDCSIEFNKRFTYAVTGNLETAFIEVVSDDGSIYSDVMEENTFTVGATAALTTSFSATVVDFVTTYGGPARFLSVQNLDASIKITGELSGDTNVTFVVAAGETFMFNQGDMAITMLRLKSASGTPSASWIASIRSTFNS